MRLKLVVVLWIFMSSGLFAQPRVVTLIAGIDSTYIGGFEELSHVYISLEELSRALRLHYVTLQSTGKLDVYSERGTLLFTPDNNFVLSLNADGTSRLYQMPLPILSANRKLYIAASYVGDYFPKILRGSFQYNQERSEIQFSLADTLPPELLAIRNQEKANGALVQVMMSRLPKNCEAAIGPDNSLYLTLLPAVADTLKVDSLPPSQIYSSVLAIQNPNSVQLIFKLKENFESKQMFVDSSTNSVMVALYSKADVKKIVTDEIKQRLEDEKKNWKFDVVVIDPGHGGKDPGAIGVTGTKEKNITLAIARALKKILNQKLPKVKVVMTRDDDEFVELDKRGEIANDAGGKLFISIHCNSMPRKPNSMNGLEVYFLRPGRTDEAIRIAAQENAAIKYENDYEKKYQSYDEDNMILTTMAHSAYVKYSEQLAQLIADNVSSMASVSDNGVNQAGFYVLVGASMPAVLVEAGYLSNRREEKYLKSKIGQNAIARGIANAVIQFKAEYEKNFTQN
jgi:N-acetylmuramoyl-L-alanine amidase